MVVCETWVLMPDRASAPLTTLHDLGPLWQVQQTQPLLAYLAMPERTGTERVERE